MVYGLICCMIVWIVSFIGCQIMKKIQPESAKVYRIYVICICILFTLFLAWYEFWA